MLKEEIDTKQASLFVWCLAGIQILLQVSLLTKGLEYVVGSLVIDDTYYYLQSAWNVRELGFVTFDGLHATNGVQFLWFVIILFLTFLASSKVALLFMTLSISFLLNGLCYLIIWRIGVSLRQPWLAVFMASLWLLQCLPFRIYSMGMENSLHALILWVALWQSLEFLFRLQNGQAPNFWGMTIILILNVWTRLDSALLSGVLFVLCVGLLAHSVQNNLRLFFQKYGRAVIGSILLAGAGFLAQLFAFHLMGDSILPVSALIKTSGEAAAVSTKDNLIQIFALGMPAILQGRFTNLVLVLIGISSIATVIVARIITPDVRGLRTLWTLWMGLLVGELIYYLYIALSGLEYRPYFIWYRSASFIFWVITGALIVAFIFAQFQQSQTSSILHKWSLISLSFIIGAVAVYMFVRSINFASKLYTTRYEVALWIAENYSPETVFAAWNAGQLGYFSNRTFINLDGLINSIDYYEQVLRGPMPLTEYLDQNKVAYIVDYNMYAAIPELPIVRSFPVDDGSGDIIQIWQLPQGSSSSQ